ncbi:MAG: cytochrome c biogenesis protein CcsA [Thermoanaerobaculum sp.]|nr:cytochrome c biogenesis protein CcsA [Thermoanaerobaculum sp.]
MYWPGVFALWAAFIAFAASTFLYWRVDRGREELRPYARQAYYYGAFSIFLASAILLYLILSHDFRLHYVFSYSDRSLPWHYLVSTFWAGQEGSFLLWIIGVFFIRFAKHYEARGLLVYNLTLLSLIAILLRQSPFRFLQGLLPGQVPVDGQGLNPLLQNFWMTIHPPAMFLGYAATAVPFALAVAALWGRRYDEWVKAALPWALTAVVTLGAAILLGGYWAYITLGWGGYWGWDPVENSSLVPWLTSSALVHGLLLQKARNRFRKLNFFLAVVSFVLVVYATFLTRSGVLADFSVHSFVDLGITGWLVFNLLFFLFLGLGFLLWRCREIPSEVGEEPFFSRTVFFVIAIGALLATATVVLVGTSSPLITRLFTKPSQVAPSFYNRVTLPVGILLATLLGVVPYLHWKGSSKKLLRRLLVAGSVAVLGTGFAILLGARGALFLVFLAVSTLAFASNLLKSIDEVRQRRFRAMGGYLAHVGLGLMLVGIITSSAYNKTQKVTLAQGQPADLFGYTLTFQGVRNDNPIERDVMLVEVRDRRGRIHEARPRMFINEKTKQLVAHPDVLVRLTHDLYISPVEYDPGRPPQEADMVELGKGESIPVGPLTVAFKAFDMGSGHSSGEELSIGAILEVVSGGTTHTVTPRLISSPAGLSSQPVEVPGQPGVQLQLVGVNASVGRIRLHVHGIPSSVAKRAVLKPGQSLDYRGLSLTFDGFDLSDFDPEAGKINIGAVVKVRDQSGREFEVTPVVRNGGQRTDAALPPLPGVFLRMGQMNAEEKLVELLVIDPSAPPDPGEPARFSADVSVKPMIGLLWTGLVVLLAGGVLAAWRRREEFA